MTYPKTDYWDAQTPEFREAVLGHVADSARAHADREIARRKAAEAEMNARELHHFESEQAMSEALGVLRAASVPPGMTEAQFYRALVGKAARILQEATK